MEYIEELKETISKMSSESIIDSISEGKESFRSDIFDLYIDEAKKRKIVIDEIIKNKSISKTDKSERVVSIVIGYFLATTGFAAVPYNIFLFFKLIRHILKIKQIESYKKGHTIAQFFISLPYTLGVIIFFIILIVNLIQGNNIYGQPL